MFCRETFSTDTWRLLFESVRRSIVGKVAPKSTANCALLRLGWQRTARKSRTLFVEWAKRRGRALAGSASDRRTDIDSPDNRNSSWGRIRLRCSCRPERLARSHCDNDLALRKLNSSLRHSPPCAGALRK